MPAHPDRDVPLLRRIQSIHPALQWTAGWCALVLVYWFCAGSGQAWDIDSIRDGATAIDMVDRGILPRHGPEVGKLGFYLSSLYFYLLAGELLLWRSMHVFAWVSILLQATSALAMLALARRLVGNRVAWIALLLFMGSSVVFASMGLFTHAAYAIPCELAGLCALYDARIAGRSAHFVPAMFLLSAAAQFHMSAFPLLLFAGVVSLASRRDIDWRHALLGWAIALIPLVPVLGEGAALEGFRRRPLLGAIFWTLHQNNALLPSLLCTLIIARPSMLTKPRQLGILAACWVAWAVWIGLEFKASGEFPGIKLFNIELHQPAPGAPQMPGAGVIATFSHLWMFWYFDTSDRQYFYIPMIVIGLLLAVLRWPTIRGEGRQLAPDTDRLTRRFLGLWALCIVPFNLAMFFGAPVPQSRYLTHTGLIAILLIAIAIDAIADKAQRGLTRFQEKWRTRLPDPVPSAMAVPAGSDGFITEIALRSEVSRPSPLLSTVLQYAASPRGRWIRETLPWAAGLLAAPPAIPILLPIAFRVAGLGRRNFPLAIVVVAQLLLARRDNASLETLAHQSTMDSIFQFASDAGLGRAFETHLHGTDRATHLGDFHGTSWYPYALLRESQRSTAADPTMHSYLRVMDEGAHATSETLPGTRLQLAQFHPQLQLDKARFVAGASRSLDTLSRSVPLPLRIASPGATPQPRSVSFVDTSPFFDDVASPNVHAAISIPRNGPAGESVLYVLLSAVATDNCRCRVRTLFNDVALGEQPAGSAPATTMEFHLPASQQAGTILVDFADCRFSFIDVFDMPVATRNQ